MVRKAIENDIQQIEKLGLLINEKFPKLFIMHEVIQEKYAKVYVFEQRGKIIGFLHVTDLGETIDIVNIAVSPEYQNQDIGSILIDYMITDATPSLKLITLEVAVDNEKAINLYKKFGFEIINIRKDYYYKKDAYLMGRKF